VESALATHAALHVEAEITTHAYRILETGIWRMRITDIIGWTDDD
jgi:hypothetical protein